MEPTQEVACLLERVELRGWDKLLAKAFWELDRMQKLVAMACQMRGAV